MQIFLGNAAVLQSHPKAEDGTAPEPTRVPELDGAVTAITIPDEVPLLVALKDVQDLWPYHSDVEPAWVSSDSEVVAMVLSAHFANATIKDFEDAKAEYLGTSDPAPEDIPPAPVAPIDTPTEV